MSKITYLIQRAAKMDWQRMWETTALLTEKSGKSRVWLLQDI